MEKNTQFPTFYEFCYNKGETVFSLINGRYSYADLMKQSVSKDTLNIKQVEVPKGWRVELFDTDNFKGKSIVLLSSECLTYSDFEDKTRSVIVTRVPVLFQNCDFEGWGIPVDVGKYTLTTLRSLRDQTGTKGDFRNQLSSLTIPYGFTVKLFEKDNFDDGGKTISLTGDAFCLTDYGFDDITSSLIVESYPVLYEFCDFGGYSLALAPGRYTSNDLRDLLKKRKVFKETGSVLSSLYVPKGYVVTLWDSDNFLGKKLDLSDTINCLNDTNFGGITMAIEVRTNSEVETIEVSTNSEVETIEVNTTNLE